MGEGGNQQNRGHKGQAKNRKQEKGGKFKKNRQQKKDRHGDKNQQESKGQAQKWGRNRQKNKNKQENPCTKNEDGPQNPKGRRGKFRKNKSNFQESNNGKGKQNGMKLNYRARRKQALLAEAQPGYKKKVRFDQDGAQGEGRLRVKRPGKKLSDSWEIKEFEERIQFIGSGLKVAYIEGVKSNQKKIDWLAHRERHEEELKQWAKHHGGLRKDGPIPVFQEVKFKNINGDLAFQIMFNIPSTATINFGSNCLIFFNYATETKVKKEKLSSFKFIEPVKYIGFLNSAKADKKNPEVIKIKEDVELRIKCGIHIMFETPVSSQTAKMLMSECADAESMSFGDICCVEFESEVDAAKYAKELRHLTLKSKTQRISFKDLSVCCVEPEAVEPTQGTEVKPRKKSEKLRLLENELDAEKISNKPQDKEERELINENKNVAHEDEYIKSEVEALKEKKCADGEKTNESSLENHCAKELEDQRRTENVETKKRKLASVDDDEYSKCEDQAGKKSTETTNVNARRQRTLEDDDFGKCEAQAIKQKTVESLLVNKQKRKRFEAIDDDDFKTLELKANKLKEENNKEQ